MGLKLTAKEIIALHMAKIGAKGGKATSEAKAAAARENAKKGGRPPGKPTKKGKLQTGRPKKK